jgi:hypothetical protein
LIQELPQDFQDCIEKWRGYSKTNLTEEEGLSFLIFRGSSFNEKQRTSFKVPKFWGIVASFKNK